jgi:ABC-type microcin C transport system permease subunit YejE
VGGAGTGPLGELLEAERRAHQMLVIGLAVWLGLNVMIPILIELATRLERHFVSVDG